MPKKVEVICAHCDKHNCITKYNAKRSFDKHGMYLCLKCVMLLPKVSQRNSEIQKIRFSDKINREKMSNSLKKYFSDDTAIAKKSDATKLLWQSKEYQDKIATTMTNKWRDELFANSVIDGVKNSWTDIRKNNQSIITNNLWNDPIYQSTQHIARIEMWKSEEYRAKQIAATERLWQSDEYRIKQAAAMSNAANTSILDDIIIAICRQLDFDTKSISLGPWVFDCFFEYNGHKILIEAQGDYWHNKPECIIRDKQKHTYYNKYLSKEYKLLIVWEHEFYCIGGVIDKILDIAGIATQSIEFNIKNLNVEIIDRIIAEKFFNQYHYLRKSRPGLHIGALLNGNLVACLTYSSITRKETAIRLGIDHHDILELSRLSVNKLYHKKNLCSYLISKSVKMIKTVRQNVKVLVTFADTTLGHTGTVYKASGWTEDGTTEPTYWYVNKNAQYRHKKTVWDQAKRLQMSECNYAIYCGLIRIEGKKLIRYIKYL